VIYLRLTIRKLNSIVNKVWEENMAVKKVIKKTEKTVEVAPEAKHNSSGGSMKEKMFPVLIGLIVVGAFAIGLLYGKVSVYEKGAAGVKTAVQTSGNNQAAAQPQAEPTEGPISPDQWNKLIAQATAVEGNKQAKVTMVEFTDYQCPYCERYYSDAYGKIKENYIDNGKIQYILRDLPLPFHQYAKPAALAARCAGEQNKYWEMHELLFKNQSDWSQSEPKEKFATYAKQVGLNLNQFQNCYSSGKYNQAIDADNALAAQVGASGTPTFIINGEKIVGAQPLATFQQTLDQALAK
jgi:protein-disulfide isomerase